MQTMLPLALWLLAATPAPMDVDVYVPLCDSALIACGPGAAGDPESLDGNLYWGAKYGAERYLSRAPGFAVVRKTDKPFAAQPWVLRSVELVRRGQHRGEGEIRVRLLGYSGKHIDQALADFLGAASGASPAAVVVWAGHDRLMDVAAPPVARGEGKPVVVLACTSERYFGPALKAGGAWARAVAVAGGAGAGVRALSADLACGRALRLRRGPRSVGWCGPLGEAGRAPAREGSPALRGAQLTPGFKCS